MWLRVWPGTAMTRKATAGLVNVDKVAVAHPHGGRFDALVCRGMDRDPMALAQFSRTADVIVVMMGQQDAMQPQLPLRQRLLDHGRITGVDHECIAIIIVDQPDVVVGQCR